MREELGPILIVVLTAVLFLALFGVVFADHYMKHRLCGSCIEKYSPPDCLQVCAAVPK